MYDVRGYGVRRIDPVDVVACTCRVLVSVYPAALRFWPRTALRPCLRRFAVCTSELRPGEEVEMYKFLQVTCAGYVLVEVVVW